MVGFVRQNRINLLAVVGSDLGAQVCCTLPNSVVLHELHRSSIVVRRTHRLNRMFVHVNDKRGL